MIAVKSPEWITERTTADVIEDVEFMLDMGEWPARVAARLRMDQGSLFSLLRRNGREDLAARLGSPYAPTPYKPRPKR